MTFVWDQDKYEINLRKHRISFYDAAAVFDDPQRIEIPDLQHSDLEERYITIGLVHDILYVVYCDRDNPETGEIDTRLISARKAKGWEIELYNNNVQGRY
ncbi:MAG: BrnT family toxin [Oscillospiraceae bacterium]|nr:BrnT family toxin [Oscillospiraceae bacterium]